MKYHTARTSLVTFQRRDLQVELRPGWEPEKCPWHLKYTRVRGYEGERTTRRDYLQSHCVEIDAAIILSCRAPISSKPSHTIFQSGKLRYYLYASRHVERFQAQTLRKPLWKQSQPNTQNYTVAKEKKMAYRIDSPKLEFRRHPTNSKVWLHDFPY